MAIVVFGSVFVDIKGHPYDVFVPNGRNSGWVETVYGGVSRNVTENLSNLGLEPVFVSLVDNSPTGGDVVRKLSEAGCDIRYIRWVPGSMGTWLAVFDERGDVFASISKRPDLAPIGEILDEFGDEIISAADSIILEIDMPSDIVKRIYDLAERYGVQVYALVSNISFAVENIDMIRRTECFVCNLQEAEQFFSESYEGFSPSLIAEKVASGIRRLGIRRMVVTLGENGCVFADPDGSFGTCDAESVEPKDTTGAGDAFFSGVAASLTYGLDIRDACRNGTRMAAETIMRYENVVPRHEASEFGIFRSR
ncbi:MAG: carbohydrate kinase family protein [Eubacteriaceae bacterium]|nr:carbohydrate kinase family protein [Eubacteriaceae bacterium]